ncbi:MAG: transposase [Polyangiales bacterium]
MKLVVQVQLRATPKHKDALGRTMRAANAACDWLSERAFESGTFAQYALHKLAYADCRQAFRELSSQVVVRCIAKVADAYKLDRNVQRSFRPLGSIAYDARILSWQGEAVSIWTIEGRQRIPFVCGDRQRELLTHEVGETDLVFSEGRYYLFVTVDVPDTEERKVMGWLGVDVGVVNIATGIRARARASRSQRRVLHSWAFGDLQAEIAYKAQRAGVPVCFVDPRNSSRECRVCGHVEKANRRTRDVFACKGCGHTADPDANAACVIAGRAAVDRPHAGSVEVVVSHGADLQSSAL